MLRTNSSLTLGALAVPVIAFSSTAMAQSEFFPATTIPGSSVGSHFEFANTAGTGSFTQFNFTGVATHADTPPPGFPPILHTLVIVFEWRIAPGLEHDFTNWGQSVDHISTVVGGMSNPFSTGTFITPGAWDTVAVHFYAGFPITVTGMFNHEWTTVPAPGAIAMFGISACLGAIGRRRRLS